MKVKVSRPWQSILKNNQLLKVTEAAQSLMKENRSAKERGIQIETLRTMIIGIPNAGKSTLMNRLAEKLL